MKKIFKVFFLLLMMIPLYTKADLQLRDYSSAVNRANGYINDYSDRNKYLMFNQKYEYINGSNTNNSSFTMGGMISKEEFELTRLDGSTYLEIGKEYWTLSTPTSNSSNKYYVDVTLRNKASSERSGVRVTEFVKPAVNTYGKGTYANPYIFEEGYLIDIRSNNTSYGKVNVTKTSVRPGESVDVTLVVTNGYRYNSLKDNCGLTKITDTKYRLENINRDVTCTMVFEKAVYGFTLDNTKTYATQPNPNKIYYNYQVGWFSDLATTNAISSVSIPVVTGYTFNGYKYGSINVINASGNIVAGNNMALQSDDWLKTTINLTLQGNPITYTIAYNSNGGTGAMGSVTHTYDVSKNLSESTFVNPGYEFLKWNTKADGSGTSYTDKQSVINLTSTQGAIVTLYAQWSKCAAGTYSNNSTPRCTPCAAGKISAAGASTCTNCNAGTYASGTGNTVCSTCVAGTYSLAGAASCPACPSGYTSNAGTGAQNQCYISVSAGKYIATANSATQTNCAAGTYKGAHTVNYGQTSSCATCAAGTYSLAGAGACTTCPSGYTSAAGATAQNKCYISVTAGKYIATANSSTQTACAAGKYSSAHTVYYGSTSSCSTCSAGTYNTGTGNSTCVACEAGYYCTGGSHHVACVLGSYSAASASSCVACQGGKTTSAAGNASCNANCSNLSHVTSWNTASWSSNTMNNLCSAKTCEAGYYLSSNKCNANTYYVKYNANGGTGDMANSTHTYGVASNLRANTFTRTGYTYGGWNTKADGTGTSYADKASVSTLTTTNGGTVNLYAKWLIKVNVVTTALCTNPTYNGSNQAIVTSAGTGYTWYSGSTAKNAGSQNVVARLNSGYIWSDGTTSDKTISCSINTKQISVSWGSTTSFTYSGSGQAPTASATTGVSGETITVSRTTQTNVGSYTSTASCSSVSGGNAKCSNYALTNNSKSYTINAKKLSTPSVTITTAGKIRWGNVSNASSYQVRVNGGSWATSTSDSTSIPTTTNGTHTVSVRAVGTGNFSTSDNGNASATISNQIRVSWRKTEKTCNPTYGWSSPSTITTTSCTSANPTCNGPSDGGKVKVSCTATSKTITRKKCNETTDSYTTTCSTSCNSGYTAGGSCTWSVTKTVYTCNCFYDDHGLHPDMYTCRYDKTSSSTVASSNCSASSQSCATMFMDDGHQKITCSSGFWSGTRSCTKKNYSWTTTNNTGSPSTSCTVSSSIPQNCTSSNAGVTYTTACTTQYSKTSQGCQAVGYSFGNETSSTVSSCTENTITCASGNSGKVNVTCTANYGCGSGATVIGNKCIKIN